MGLARLLVPVLMTAVAAACSTSPTAPSSAAGASHIVGTASQGPVAVPARIIDNVPPRAVGATRFLAFGDSITWGAMSSFDGIFLSDVPGSYPSVLLGMLRQYNASAGVPAGRFFVGNAGVPGETARVGIDRLPGELDLHQPEVLLLLEGINDMNFGASATQAAANVHYMVQIARLFNCTVLVATMPQTYPAQYPDQVIRNQSADKIVPYNNEIRRLMSGMQNVYVVDVYAAFGNDRSLMGNDGLHPTPAGYQRMAQAFHAVIEQVFPVRGSLQ